ncbi:glycosyltransferase [Chryseobacterium sp.]|uniref:glycosyltransferase n=1 Tax=Chryseobacterium sp. TaxID=1871047 RepID=UPI00388DB772
MKIAYCIRQDWDSPSNKGGDTTQLLKTMENVLNYDNSVSILVLTDPNLLDESFDIAHIFNFATLDISKAFYERAKSLGIKIAFSTIFWNYSYGYRLLGKHFDNNFFRTIDRYFFLSLGKIINKPVVLSSKFKAQSIKFIKGADVLLPNSIEEYYQLCHFTNLDPEKYINKVSVVFNAADVKNNVYIEKSEFLKKYDLPDKPYILQVGRIQLIKGQLNVVKALMDVDIPIVFVGFKAEQHYFQKIKEISKKRGNVFFVDYVDNKEVCNFYKYASLHVLASLRESPGLVSLEALLNNCKVVTSNQKYLPFDTYFNKIATAVDPVDINSIKNGILNEIKTERNFDAIKNIIVSKFSWEKVGIDTYKAYKKIL